MTLLISSKKVLLSTALSAVVLAGIAPAAVQADNYNHNYENDFRKLTIYFTRHAEKQPVTVNTNDFGIPQDVNDPQGPATGDTYITQGNNENFVRTEIGNTGASSAKSKRLDTACGTSKCAEELSDRGELHAELLADWFEARQITNKLDAVYATNKTRTQQTVTPTAERVGENGLTVITLPTLNEDGSAATELNPESTGPSECATLDAIQDARNAGYDTILIAGHSGTLYDIMGDGTACGGLGLNIGEGDNERFPKDGNGKVKNFGDIWKVVIKRNGEARFVYRKLLKPVKLKAVETVW